MAKVTGVKFHKDGRVYYFATNGVEAKAGDGVIVETAKGLEYGEVTFSGREIEEEQLVHPLKNVIRVATAEDKAQVEKNAEKEKKAFKVCEEKIAQYGLDMKLTSAEYSFEGNKVLFCFISENRVDFRELVKDLASTLHARIELRQIGVRDEARMLGGLGICGQPFCCKRFLDDFQPVSIKMAKEQGLSLNPTKISGSCGRLMCCLKYEQNSYDYYSKRTPRVGTLVKTALGTGEVIEAGVLSGMLRVNPAGEGAPFVVHRDDVTILRAPMKGKKDKKQETNDEE
ncbi:MAG: stage 0 sporulation family protein [Clostridia bacterium]|nr:stage 0 sporulation family protein [Clostridia bacterium]